ncbi:MAG: PD-(D/E)XK nuclease family protein [Bacillota bacterium]|nr:PD-(D/E)XK nuclease family protein [Bacillota bacterium]
MLNIYYGAETLDKEKFIFDNIKGRTLLLVPDQFSLQAERDAFFYLEKNSLMDLRIVDFSTLGHKVVREVGGKKPELIDKYGSQMLLTKVLDKVDDRLKIFAGSGWKSSFIDSIYDVISDMKRYGVEPEELRAALDKMDDNGYLKYKLEDIAVIYDEYQERIKDKYLDAEDYILFYGDKIMKAPMVKKSEVWIYGFDTFTPKNYLVIERLIKTARNVNIVMTYEEGNEIFNLTKYVMDKLCSIAEDLNEEVEISTIDGEARTTVWSKVDCDAPITLVGASDVYAEAERAASYVLSLVRDQGYRFGDIVVVCNDMQTRGSILARTFAGWGIPLFVDKKRPVMHHPAVGCLLAIMENVAKGYKTASVMRIAKSGLLGFTAEECEILENYVEAFKIRGAAWKSDFKKTGNRYSEEELLILNELRRTVTDTIEKAADAVGRYNTAAEKAKGLYSFLDRDFDMRGRLESLMARQDEGGFAEAAAETAQSWNVICGILDQIVEILGEERISNEELLKLLIIGMQKVQIGLVPTSSDRVIMGTLQRTRLSRVKVLLIVGANIGVLPLESGDEGLISDREKAALEGMDIELSKRDDVVRKEEALAIHRTLHLPEERLYISYAGGGEEGEIGRPSEVFEKVREYLEEKGKPEVLGNIDAEDDVFDMLTSREGTLSYMTEALRKYLSGGELDEKWLQIMNWFEENHPEMLEKVSAGMTFDNDEEMLGKNFADALYMKDYDKLTVSASRLEKYSSCPFAHFMRYGLRLQEPMVYEMGHREIGDIYHYCLMKLSEKLTPTPETGMSVNDPQSPWMTVTEQQCRDEIRNIIAGDMEGFKEGLMDSGKAESYRTERIADICADAAWSMVKQVRKGHIKAMHFEEPFGRGKVLPPVTVDAGGKEVLIQGKIDRVDVLDGDAVRVIDYKTGSDTVDVEHIRNGYKLQLMVYLKAAMGSNVEPAGVFYFKIDDLETDADQKDVSGGQANVSKRVEEAYKLVGIVLDDEKLIEAMDEEIAGGAITSSTVLPIKMSSKDKTLSAYSGSHLLPKEVFDELMEQVDVQVKRICEEICDGNIAIKPKKERKPKMGEQFSACKYCDYKGICMFDTTLPGCRFEMV